VPFRLHALPAAGAVALEARRKAHSAAAAAIQARVEQCIIDHETRINPAEMASEHHQRIESLAPEGDVTSRGGQGLASEVAFGTTRRATWPRSSLYLRA